MAEGTIGSFFTKINNEVEKQMNDDLKKFGINANELEMLIELNHHQHGKTFEKLAKELHVTNDKVKSLTKNWLPKICARKLKSTVQKLTKLLQGCSVKMKLLAWLMY